MQKSLLGLVIFQRLARLSWQTGFLLLSLIAFSITIYTACKPENKPNASLPTGQKTQSGWLNTNPEVAYLGSASCTPCHGKIHQTFIHTGKGRAFGKLDRTKSIEDFNPSVAHVYDTAGNLHYRPLWKNDSLMIAEYRISGKDTVHYLARKASYVIGSGNQTQSYIYSSNGYLYEMPITWYARKKIWDLSPGFAAGHNSRFDRPIGEKCLNCHVGDSKFTQGSVNRFLALGNDIGCEKCHGPGSIHVKLMLQNKKVDTTKGPDYSIVNPKRLSLPLQLDVCRQCHLEGITVPEPNKNPMDYRPGLALNSFFKVFIPTRNKTSDYGFASHAERLQLSRCFTESGGRLSCTTCHNPHKPLEDANNRISQQNPYDLRCLTCHTDGHKTCSRKMRQLDKKGIKQSESCIACHLPRSGVTDIPHVSTTDHFIRIRNAENKPDTDDSNLTNNEPFPVFRNFTGTGLSDRELALANLEYYEKVKAKPGLIDKIARYVHNLNPNEQIKFAYLSNRNLEGISLATDTKQVNNAFTAFYLGELWQKSRPELKEAFYQRAVSLAPYNLNFRNRLAEHFLNNRNWEMAIFHYLFLLNQNPNFEKANTNLGFAYLMTKQYHKALFYTQKAITLNPEAKTAFENEANIYIQQGQYKQAIVLVRKLINRYPNNEQYRTLLRQLNNL